MAGRSESADRKGATAEAIRGNLVGGAVVALMSALAAWEGTATGLLHDLVDAAPRAKLIVRDQYRRVLTAWVAHRLLIRRLNEVRNNLTKPPPARMDNAAAQTRGSP